MAKTAKERNEYIEAWQREHIKRVVVKLNKTTDKDILDILEKQKSVQGYIKEAIREYSK